MSGPHPRQRIRLADVAVRAGVSRATASRALSGDRRISESTRDAVREAAAALGYVPNVAARGLRARTTQALGLMLSDLSDPVHGQVAAGFELAAAAAGYTVIIVAAHDVVEQERRALTAFVERSVDGVCIASSALDPDEARERVAPSPLVVVQPDHERILGPDALPPGTIRTDERSGMEQAVRHLLAGGHRDIAYLGAGTRATNVLRSRAAEQVLRESADLPLRVSSVPEDSWGDPRALADALGPRMPDAVVCYDDKLALALLDGLRSRGFRVPDDVAVVGFDDIPFAALSNPRLTTVSTPTPLMGRLAAETLLATSDALALPPPVVLPVQLVVRESAPQAAGVAPPAHARRLVPVARG
jgi:LacI family transcriptional regulator